MAGLTLLIALAVHFRGEETRPEPAAPRARPAPGERAPEGPPVSSARNPFEYVGASADAGPPLPPVAASTPPPPVASPPPDPVRLVGFVRAGRELRAVLAVSGEVQVAAAGAVVGDSTLVSVDEDLGVLLQGPAGETRRLAPPSHP
jgi:hypothetical protein